MSHFRGQFFFVTQWSVWSVNVEDLLKSPVVMKMRTRQFGKELEVPVTGTMNRGFYVAITSQGVFKYNAMKGQRAVIDGLPKRFEEVAPARRRSAFRAFAPIAFFLNRNEADICFDDEPTEIFMPRWHEETQATLCAIGKNHPLVTVSTEGEFAVPEHLYTPRQEGRGEIIRVVL